MKILRTVILLIISGCGLSYAGQQTAIQLCNTVREILDSASAVKVGMNRADLEKSFTVGSFGFRTAATYVSKSCRYVAVDVEFEPAASSVNVSPADKITKISRPYLAYPSMD